MALLEKKMIIVSLLQSSWDAITNVVSDFAISITFLSPFILAYFVYVYYRIYGKNKFSHELINFMLIFLCNIPNKWFDWLKWVLIIGFFSYIQQSYSDIYLDVIIYISYLTIFIDSFNFIYNSASEFFSKPVDAIASDIEAIESDLDDAANELDIIAKRVQDYKDDERESKLERMRYDQTRVKNLYRKIDETKIYLNALACILSLSLTYIIYLFIQYVLYVYTLTSEKP